MKSSMVKNLPLTYIQWLCLIIRKWLSTNLEDQFKLKPCPSEFHTNVLKTYQGLLQGFFQVILRLVFHTNLYLVLLYFQNYFGPVQIVLDMFKLFLNRTKRFGHCSKFEIQLWKIVWSNRFGQRLKNLLAGPKNIFLAN